MLCVSWRARVEAVHKYSLGIPSVVVNLCHCHQSQPVLWHVTSSFRSLILRPERVLRHGSGFAALSCTQHLASGSSSCGCCLHRSTVQDGSSCGTAPLRTGRVRPLPPACVHSHRLWLFIDVLLCHISIVQDKYLIPMRLYCSSACLCLSSLLLHQLFRVIPVTVWDRPQFEQAVHNLNRLSNSGYCD